MQALSSLSSPSSKRRRKTAPPPPPPPRPSLQNMVAPTTPSSSVAFLPDALINAIMMYMGPHEVNAMRRTCKDFCAALDMDAWLAKFIPRRAFKRTTALIFPRRREVFTRLVSNASQSGVELHARDDDATYPVEYACRFGFADVVQRLLTVRLQKKPRTHTPSTITNHCYSRFSSR